MLSTFNLEEVIDAYAGALNWLRNVDVDTKGRLEHYSTVLRDRLERQIRDPSGDHEYLVTLYEAMDISQFSALPVGLIDDAARIKLQAIATGANSYVDAKDDSCRNYAFEFATASWMQRFHELKCLDVPCDVSSAIGPFTLHTECKRPQGENSLYSNIQEAISKVRKTTENERYSYGVAALEISRLINPRLEPFNGNSIPDIEAMVDIKVSQLLERNQKKLDKLKRHTNAGPKFLGTMLKIAVPGYLPDTKNFIWVSLWRAQVVPYGDANYGMAMLFFRPMNPQAERPIEYRGNTVLKDGSLLGG